jgi:uncharacterized protein
VAKGESALILMAKAPVPGTVKTRLCPPLSPRAAAALYSCLLEDIADEMSARLPGVRRILFHSPPGGDAHFRSAPFRGFELRPQRGAGLGERMEHALRTVLLEGAGRAVVIGADCPSLSAGRVRAAFRELSRSADVVLGPSEDGGFHLIGMGSPRPSLFRKVAWGGRSVLSDVCLRCRAAGLTYAFLPVEFDVDTPDDLSTLRRWADSRGTPPCPRTRRWLTGR